MADKQSDGMYRGPSHKDGGIPVVVDGTTNVELEGYEIKLCNAAFNSPQKLSFSAATNKEVLDYIHNKFSCHFKQDEANSGEFILCKVVVFDATPRDRRGTVKQILNEMQSEKGCRLDQGSKPQPAMEKGGVILKSTLPGTIRLRTHSKEKADGGEISGGKRLLSLFDYSGQWSDPFFEGGWEVIQWDIKLSEFMDLMLVDSAEEALELFEDIDGIIAAPPCTDFTNSGAQWWTFKDEDGRTQKSIDLVNQVMKLVDLYAPTDPDYDGRWFWAIENPVGRMGKLVGIPEKPWYFDPYEFAGWLNPSEADLAKLTELRKKFELKEKFTMEEAQFVQKMNAYTKKTGLWGQYAIPEKNPIPPVYAEMGGQRTSPMFAITGGKSAKTKELRSDTPEGFAKAFYEANKDYQAQLQPGYWDEEEYPGSEDDENEEVFNPKPDDRVIFTDRAGKEHDVNFRGFNGTNKAVIVGQRGSGIDQMEVEISQLKRKLVEVYQPELDLQEKPTDPSVLNTRLKLLTKMLAQNPDNAILKTRKKIVKAMVDDFLKRGIENTKYLEELLDAVVHPNDRFPKGINSMSEKDLTVLYRYMKQEGMYDENWKERMTLGGKIKYSLGGVIHDMIIKRNSGTLREVIVNTILADSYYDKNSAYVIADGVIKVDNEILKYTPYNPIMTRFGEYAYFYPHEENIKRDGIELAYIKYAAHLITQKNEQKGRTLDISKERAIHLIEPALREADARYIDKKEDGTESIIYVKKNISTRKHTSLALVIEMNMMGQLRLVAFMPDRKKISANWIESTPMIPLSKSEPLTQLGDIQGNKEHGESPESKSKDNTNSDNNKMALGGHVYPLKKSEVESQNGNELASLNYVLRHPNDAIVFVDADMLLTRHLHDEPEYAVLVTKNQIGNRVENAKEFLKKNVGKDGVYFEPSVAGIYNGKLSFEDGRHRVLAAKELGYNTVAVEVPKDQVALFEKEFSPRIGAQIRAYKDVPNDESEKLTNEEIERLSNIDFSKMDVFIDPSMILPDNALPPANEEFDWNALYAEAAADNSKYDPQVDIDQERESAYQKSGFSKKWAPTYKDALFKLKEKYTTALETKKEWESKQYKPNKRVVEVGAKDSDFGPALSIGAINESRKKKRIAGAEMDMKEALEDLTSLGLTKEEIGAFTEKAKKYVENPPGDGFILYGSEKSEREVKFGKKEPQVEPIKVGPNKAGRNQIKKYGIDIIDAKKHEPSNILLEEKYKVAEDSELPADHTFELFFILKSKIDQQKPFAVGYFGDSRANRYEYASASNDLQELIQTMKDYDQQEAVVEVYDPATKEVSASVIYPEANTYTYESLGLVEKEKRDSLKVKLRADSTSDFKTFEFYVGDKKIGEVVIDHDRIMKAKLDKEFRRKGVMRNFILNYARENNKVISAGNSEDAMNLWAYIKKDLPDDLELKETVKENDTVYVLPLKSRSNNGLKEQAGPEFNDSGKEVHLRAKLQEWKDIANAEYERECKKAKIWELAQKDAAPKDKIEQIKNKLTKKYKYSIDKAQNNLDDFINSKNTKAQNSILNTRLKIVSAKVLEEPNNSTWKTRKKIIEAMIENAGLADFDKSESIVAEIDKRLSLAKESVDGRIVRSGIPNRSSIDASLGDKYKILTGIREVPFTEFPDMGDLRYYDAHEKQKTQKLSEEIKESGEISPLIVVYDRSGAYVLEGGHRFDALRELKAKSFPALVVIDTEDLLRPEEFADGGEVKPAHQVIVLNNSNSAGDRQSRQLILEYLNSLKAAKYKKLIEFIKASGQKFDDYETVFYLNRFYRHPFGDKWYGNKIAYTKTAEEAWSQALAQDDERPSFIRVKRKDNVTTYAVAPEFGLFGDYLGDLYEPDGHLKQSIKDNAIKELKEELFVDVNNMKSGGLLSNDFRDRPDIVRDKLLYYQGTFNAWLKEAGTKSKYDISELYSEVKAWEDKESKAYWDWYYKIDEENRKYTLDTIGPDWKDRIRRGSSALMFMLFEFDKKLDEMGMGFSYQIGAAGNPNSPLLYHFTTPESLLAILSDGYISGYQQENEGYGGVATSTDPNLDDRGIVLWFGSSEGGAGRTTADQAVRIDLSTPKIKAAGYSLYEGDPDAMGTFYGEKEIRIVDLKGKKNPARISESQISNIGQFIVNVQLNEDLIHRNEMNKLLAELAKHKIPHTFKFIPHRAKLQDGGVIEKQFKKLTGDTIQIAKAKLGGFSLRQMMGRLDESPPYTDEALQLIERYDNQREKSLHLYHTTPKEKIADIAKEGLVPGKPARFKGVSSANKISLAASEAIARYYGGPDDVMIRVKQGHTFDDLEVDALGGGEGAYLTGNGIPASELEIKIDGKWQPISHYKPKEHLKLATC